MDMDLDWEGKARRSAHSESLPEERTWHTGHPGYGQRNRRAKTSLAEGALYRTLAVAQYGTLGGGTLGGGTLGGGTLGE